MKIGLIGCGIWGRKILRELLDLEVSVVVVDADPRMGVELAADCSSVVVIADLAHLEQVDGFIVATPAHTHRAVIEALDVAGYRFPIFCEKPLATTSEDARWLANRSQGLLSVMHIWSFHPGVRKLRELYQSGVIGELTQLRSVRANWTSPRTDVDCLLNLAPHDLSIFQYILGELPKPVWASGEWIGGQLVSCLAELRSSDNISAIFEVSNRYGEKRREVRLHGTKGVLVLPDDASGCVQLIRGEGFIVPEQVEVFEYSAQSALRVEIESFLQSIERGDFAELPAAALGADIVYALDIIRGLLH